MIAGDSAGGGLALATLLAIRASRDPMPAGCVAILPWADLTCSGKSMLTQADTDIMCDRDSLRAMAGLYLAGADGHDQLASPVFADFSGLPPLLAVVGGGRGALG